MAPLCRVGGVEAIKEKYFAWTGSDATTAVERKSISKMESMCQEGLPVMHSLSALDKIMTEATAISFQTWIERLKASLEDTGMNSAFPIEDGAAKDKHNILDEFGCADIAMVKDWVLEWYVKGCEYDEKNMVMSGKMLLESLDLNGHKKTKCDLPTNAMGNEVYAVIVNLHQSLNTSAMRVLTEQLQKLKRSKEAGENVETVASKVTDIAKDIQGAGTDTYQASKCHKEKKEAQLPQAQVKSLQKMMADDFSEAGGAKPLHADNEESNKVRRCCNHCAKKRKEKPKVANAGASAEKPKVVSAGASAEKFKVASAGLSAQPAASDNGRKTAPKDGKLQTNEVDGVDCKWCNTCKSWNKGEVSDVTTTTTKAQATTILPMQWMVFTNAIMVSMWWIGVCLVKLHQHWTDNDATQGPQLLFMYRARVRKPPDKSKGRPVGSDKTGQRMLLAHIIEHESVLDTQLTLFNHILRRKPTGSKRRFMLLALQVASVFAMTQPDITISESKNLRILLQRCKKNSQMIMGAISEEDRARHQKGLDDVLLFHSLKYRGGTLIIDADSRYIDQVGHIAAEKIEGKIDALKEFLKPGEKEQGIARSSVSAKFKDGTAENDIQSAGTMMHRTTPASSSAPRGGLPAGIRTETVPPNDPTRPLCKRVVHLQEPLRRGGDKVSRTKPDWSDEEHFQVPLVCQSQEPLVRQGEVHIQEPLRRGGDKGSRTKPDWSGERSRAKPDGSGNEGRAKPAVSGNWVQDEAL